MIGVFGSILKELLGGPGPFNVNLCQSLALQMSTLRSGGWSKLQKSVNVAIKITPFSERNKLNCPKYSVNTLYATVTLKEGCCWIAHFASIGT